MFNAYNSNAIIFKSKNFSSVFCCIYQIYINFGILWTNRSGSQAICFWYERLQKVGFLKCLKSPSSKHLWAVNMLKGPRDCVDLHCSIFVIFFITLKKKISSKYSVLVVSEILRLFVNILTPDDKYSLSGKASVWRNQFKWIYLKIKKYFPKLLPHFQDLHKVWNTLKKKTSPRGDFFLRLWSRNGGVSYMHKKPLGRTLMGSLHVKGSERLLKSARQYLCHIICSLWNKISSKNSVLVVSEILRLFVNILTPDEKYCLSVKACF